jgi:serine/threonine protein phosphatase PrpC
MKLATFEQPESVVCYEQGPDDVVLAALAGGQVAAFSARNPEKETPSEDCVAAIAVDAERGVLIVADGLGGLPAGEHASRVAIDRLTAAITTAVDEGIGLRTAILNGFEAANQAVIDTGMGATTLAVVEIDGDAVRPYHVGDSMILVLGQRGKVKHQTVSHSPVGYAVEAGFLDDEEAMHHEERHLISNMVGSAEMHITIGSALRLSARDTLIVASDGLSDNLRLDEIVERVRKGPLAKVAAALIHDSQARMTNPTDGHPSKPDDLSFVVYRGR